MHCERTLREHEELNLCFSKGLGGILGKETAQDSPQLLSQEDEPPLQHGRGEDVQDEDGAEPLEQRWELHVLQVGVHRTCELNELRGESHQGWSEGQNVPSVPT